MTRDEIQAEFDKFIEFPTDDKSYITTVSAMLFAEHIAKMAAAKERQKWEPVIEGVMRELPKRGHKPDDGNAPGHCHKIPGIWDSDNGELAGTICAWCAAWNAAKEVIRSNGNDAPHTAGA